MGGVGGVGSFYPEFGPFTSASIEHCAPFELNYRQTAVNLFLRLIVVVRFCGRFHGSHSASPVAPAKMRTWASAVQPVFHPTDQDLSAGTPVRRPEVPVAMSFTSTYMSVID